MSILAIAVFCAIATLIFWLVATGRGETQLPRGVDTFAIKGIDISAHNGYVDFNAVKRAGYSFAMIKATEGATHKDKAFLQNALAARRAGLRVGAYHFFRFDTPGYMQAINLLNSVRGMPLDMPVAIDVEEWTNPTDRSTESIVAEIEAMASKLKSEGGLSSCTPIKMVTTVSYTAGSRGILCGSARLIPHRMESITILYGNSLTGGLSTVWTGLPI